MPSFVEIVEPPIVGNVFGGEMAVVIEYWLRRRGLMIESLGNVIGEQEIFIEKGLHRRS